MTAVIWLANYGQQKCHDHYSDVVPQRQKCSVGLALNEQAALKKEKSIIAVHPKCADCKGNFIFSSVDKKSDVLLNLTAQQRPIAISPQEYPGLSD